ncbi:DUF3320 domain-containing protein [Hymenobacter sp. BT507]|uniref:DUF3320 domain-containing protein n=1 Tax=Hymenobacter citatus TaxID=2763506 RepID=A0ABR7MMS6_9BACT|nr:DUF3320 domain-containing protein [Hymenobacter citatus]MBC6612377.1 DUF3320 domain-containing protein [Hymenobacter citatus]
MLSADFSLAKRLHASREELLDLSLHNPLLNFRVAKARGVQVVHEQSAAVYDILVRQGKAMYFLADSTPRHGQEDAALNAAITVASDAEAEPLFTIPATALSDNKLQTAEPLAKLEARLLNTYYTARTSLEEQGVNILYLALGSLTWYESAGSEEARRAPLVLVPVLLERGTVAERFKLRYTGAEVEGNLSLQAKLKATFGLTLPLPEPEDEGGLNEYYAAVQQAVAPLSHWQVAPDDIALGFFSFGKLMLYRDLDPATWPASSTLLDHPTIAALLGSEGFRDPAPTLGETAFLDTDSPVAELHQVLDADSSQLLALLAVHEGRNLVIQGPPGTGKSQTIANLLAEAIGAGKKVLFVAEKMAALEVVKRRLDSLGLGVACLELHSHKANKKTLHNELKATLALGRPTAGAHVEDHMAQLPRYRQQLNDYALAVNAPIGRSRRTAQQVTGELLRLQEKQGGAELLRLPFTQLATWTDADAAHAEALAGRLQATLQKIGTPKQLLFWGSALTLLLPADQTALTAHLHAAHAAVTALQSAAEALAHHLGLSAPHDRAAAETLLPSARHAQQAPPLADAAVTDPTWGQQHNRLVAALQAGEKQQQLHQQYDTQLLPEAWQQELLAERATLLQYGDKWWKFLSGDYRRARKRLQSLWQAPLPTKAADVVAVVDAIREAARHEQTLAEAEPLLQTLFGSMWQGRHSDWRTLRKVQEYLTLTHQRIARGELPPALLSYLAASPSRAAQPSDRESLGQLTQEVEAALVQQRTAVQAVVDGLQLNEVRRFGPDGRLQFQPFDDQLRTLPAWAADLSALQLTVEWNNVAAAVEAEQLPELLRAAENWPEAGQLLAAAVRQTWLEYLQRSAYEQHSALRQFEQAGHEEVAARFRHADRDSLYHHRVRAVRRHYEQLPNQQAGGQMLVLKNEFAKKTRHLPLRQLMERAGQAVQAIKPVFMMSPLSVASFLPPGAVEFDIVVFDEASQVKPVEALGAIARGRQLVVVGDSKQLPPTSFFDSLTNAGEETDEDNVTADIQSILELCTARQMSERMLRWHYRSRHESLIAASNHLFYDDKLVVFPSPGDKGKLGLVYHYLSTTYYERGTSRTNPREAAAVAAAVLHHARTTPQLTLGVVAFSVAQRQAIQDALEALRRQHPETEAFFNGHLHEPFFIKNLENVQGDERDVILISLGYGRTKEGYLAMNFGPLNGEGGERRLNVLITRAKQRCEIFTNLTSDDLDLSRTQAKGVAALKAFLSFAQHGHLHHNAETGRVEAPFEEVVRRALTARGYQVRQQVGSQRFYLDLAVVDPTQPDRYLLGIMCDGTLYHAARSARDRDRLRQQVLEAMGWRLHRIWSTDWFRNPQRALESVVAAIEEARHQPTLDEPNEPEEVQQKEEAAAPVVIEREALRSSALAVPYQVAQLPAAVGHRELHQHSLGQLANWLTQVVRIESPIHVDEATRRLAQASGATQVGARMRKVGRAAATLAANLRHLRQQGDFLWENTMQTPPLRDRSHLPAISRKLSLVAPEELAHAVCTIIAHSFALPREAVYLSTVRLLGFNRLSDEMRQQVDGAVQYLLTQGELVEVNGVLKKN